MLLVRDAYEVKIAGVLTGGAHGRMYECTEPFTDSTIWSVRALRRRVEDHIDAAKAQLWTKILCVNPQALVEIVLQRVWERVEVRVMLAGEGDDEDVRAGRCVEIWSGQRIDSSNTDRVWVFDTTVGSFIDPRLGCALEEIRRVEKVWGDEKFSFSDRGSFPVIDTAEA